MEIVAPRNAFGAVHGYGGRGGIGVSPLAVPLRRRRRSGCCRGGCCDAVRCKLSKFQDFQDYAKPSRLFPTTEIKFFSGHSEEEKMMFDDVGKSQSLYKIKLHTSRMYGSGLTDANAGILLCLIDEHGHSLLQRLSATPMTEFSVEWQEKVDHDILHFQRGSVDEFTFKGPKLGRLQALWISLESGQWRLGGVTLSVIHAHQPSLEEHTAKEIQFGGYQYDFEAEDILIGEGSDSSMIELRPSLVTESSGDPFTLLSNSTRESTSPSPEMSNEESMQEYADLKLSLLVYDAILVSVGTTVASVSAGEKAALAFLTGGLGGFVYLLILQRSVDELPTPATISRNSVDQAVRRLKGPITTLALAAAVVFGVFKYSSGQAPAALTSEELIAGMIGFIACKVAVVLAAFKPTTFILRRDD
ncbi:uncharacterized protein LOC115670533 [Syzygium oleosum]|uniref:uncharacterized protein LOC115670533 n=1 Tax=Syzygium oleosum TaxID=219896 RepID=UPI0024BBAB01|nr:uncharacterized protein LOC115670533 [Syzygium oleosum]